MRRLFEEHQLRRTCFLNGYWDFAADRENVGKTKKWHRRFPASFDRMHVPGCWDTQPGYFDYRGRAYYRRDFALDAAGPAAFTFESVSGTVSVYLDGKKIAAHRGDYTPFRALAKSVSAGAHELVVEIDHDHSGGKILPEYPCDWFFYGGITQPVEIALLDAAWIQDLFVDYSIRNGKVRMAVRAEVRNLSRRRLSETASVELDGSPVAEMDVTLDAGESGTFSVKIPEQKLSLWSPEEPNLHLVRIACAGDDLADRVGFRTLSARQGRIYLNGERLQIRGVNRHHEYGDCGFAVPPELVQRDLRILQDLGCNAVRCHYPVDVLTMDLCDEMGFLFWSEIPMYGRWPQVVANKEYLVLAETAIEEMVRRDYNRPSIFAWSVLNECATDLAKGARAAKQLAGKVRALDTSRFVTYASNRLLKDKGAKHLDIIGLNCYPGWYDHKEFLSWPDLVPAMRKKLRADGCGSMPMLVTETGAGAIYGDRGLERRQWSENYQCEILRRNLEYLLEENDVCGVFLWQFCDIRTAAAYWNGRPGTFNNKGIVDRWRRPKEAYRVVREIYRKAGGLEP